MQYGDPVDRTVKVPEGCVGQDCGPAVLFWKVTGRGHHLDDDYILVTPVSGKPTQDMPFRDIDGKICVPSHFKLPEQQRLSELADLPRGIPEVAELTAQAIEQANR